jgi:hypothetical protein
MESAPNYGLIWFVYLSAGAIFYTIFWQLTRFKTAHWAAYLLRALLAALILTPWYANSQQVVLAPALMVVLMDAITLDGAAAPRAMVPLLLAVLLAFFVALVVLGINVRRRKKRSKNN